MDTLIGHIAPTSLHQQVSDDLLQRIAAQYKPGDMLPSEASLCAEYGVSRITMRSAISKLVERGLLIRRRGVGTFVTGRPDTARSFNLVGFLDEIQAHTYRVVINEAEPASKQVARALGMEEGTPVRHLRSVIERDGEPLTVSDGYTSDTPVFRISEQDLNAGLPSVQARARRIGRRIERAEQELDAIAAESDVADYLGIAPATPIIRARRVYFATNEERVQYLEVRYHPSRYRFNVDLILRTDASAFQVSPPRGTSA